MRVRDLDVISKNIVVANLEGRDAGALALLLLQFCYPILPAERHPAKLIELCVESLSDDAPIRQCKRWIVFDGVVNEFDEIVKRIQPRMHSFQCG